MIIMTQDSVLQRIAQGDRTAVSDCIDRYGGLIWSLARRWSRTDADAEDAVQEIFLDLWKSAARFDQSVAGEKTFIAMIARRRLIDRNRKRQLQPVNDLELDHFSSEQQGQAQWLELSDEAARAAAILDELPENQSRTIRLSIYHGLSHSQIAEYTGLSLGTVKTSIRRGLLKIREQIGVGSMGWKGGAV